MHTSPILRRRIGGISKTFTACYSLNTIDISKKILLFRRLTSRRFAFEASSSASVGFFACVSILPKISQRYLIRKWRKSANTNLLCGRRHFPSKLEHLQENYNRNPHLKCAPFPPLFTSKWSSFWRKCSYARARVQLPRRFRVAPAGLPRCMPSNTQYHFLQKWVQTLMHCRVFPILG